MTTPHPNQQIFTDILPLMLKQITALQGPFGFIYTELSNVVKHSDPVIRQQRQDEVNATKNGLLVVYLFAMWEEYIERDLETDWLAADELERLNAFRHIRHSVAHGIDGQRASNMRFRNAFEVIMNGSQPFPNLPWTNDSIDLTKSQVAIDCQRLMEDLGKKLIGRIANDNRP
ncbi:MAG: hypothetical protein JKY84_09510 [Emcibacteraceae bacterium]|nr:hypothetical protein [Emcibacteraceae bacterium]